MEELLDRTLQLIGGYRAGDGDFMSREHVRAWVEQFEEVDRIFLLTELNHIFASRYISRDAIKEYFRTNFQSELLADFTNKKQLSDINQILSGLKVLHIQPPEKSQHFIIEIFAEFLMEDYNLDIDACGEEQVTGYLFLDDVCCTGSTIYSGMKTFLDDTSIDAQRLNIEVLRENKTPVILAFAAFHLNGAHNAVRRLIRDYGELGFELLGYAKSGLIIDDRQSEIATSELAFVYPKQAVPPNVLAEVTKTQIENQVDQYTTANAWANKAGHFYRPANKPSMEVLFSSSVNRDRFEQIILTKSIELYNNAVFPSEKRRPLGNGMKTEKSFGLGTLLFTWRNVPFNTPLVFWYGHNWVPLFHRNHTQHEVAHPENPFALWI